MVWTPSWNCCNLFAWFSLGNMWQFWCKPSDFSPINGSLHCSHNRHVGCRTYNGCNTRWTFGRMRCPRQCYLPFWNEEVKLWVWFYGLPKLLHEYSTLRYLISSSNLANCSRYFLFCKLHGQSSTQLQIGHNFFGIFNKHNFAKKTHTVKFLNLEQSFKRHLRVIG